MINKNSENLAKNMGNFNERNKKFLEAKNMKLMQKIREENIKNEVDEKSGQQLYTPKVAGSRSGDSRSTNIFQSLYERNRQQKSPSVVSPRRLISAKSEMIAREVECRRLAWVFSELDSDEDGQISAHKINIDRIPVKVLEIIMPILFEMEEMQVELNIDDFLMAVRNLEASLSIEEKNSLYRQKWVLAVMLYWLIGILI